MRGSQCATRGERLIKQLSVLGAFRKRSDTSAAQGLKFPLRLAQCSADFLAQG